MNFVLFHIGLNFPTHLRQCIQNIKHFNPSSKIYFLTEVDIISKAFPDVEYINVWDFDSYKLLRSNIFISSYHASLFRNSLFRYYFINEFIKKRELNNVIHFDNDVLVFEDYSKHLAAFETGDIFITPHSLNEYVCGTMYIKNNIDVICDYFASLIFKDEQTLVSYAGEGFMPNEMRLLSKLDQEKKCFSLLPILPLGEFSHNFNRFRSLFDPSSYGQHIGGTPDRPEGGWVAAQNGHRAIDPLLTNRTIDIVFENKLPYIDVMLTGKYIKLNNLHIHSKELSKYSI